MALNNNLPDLVFADGLNSQKFDAIDELGAPYSFSVRKSISRGRIAYWLADSRGLPLSAAVVHMSTVRTMVSARLAKGRHLTDETADEYNQRTNYGAF